jgi:hypothetical protein
MLPRRVELSGDASSASPGSLQGVRAARVLCTGSRDRLHRRSPEALSVALLRDLVAAFQAADSALLAAPAREQVPYRRADRVDVGPRIWPVASTSNCSSGAYR